MADGAPARIFLVGFPRSGTTLLQSLLAAHPDVLSLPETFFFVDVAPTGRRWRLLGRTHRRARLRLAELEGHGLEVAAPGFREVLPVATVAPTVRRFVGSLDANALSRGRRAWVEKTPSHLHHLDTIERYVAQARVVHIVRDGVPAIASLCSVTREHPRPWGGTRALETCVERWRNDVRRSYACLGRPNHAFVSYERLVADPVAVMESLAAELGLRSDPATVGAMLAGYADASAGVVGDEPWKASVGAPIANRNGARAARMFSEQERRKIERTIAPETELLAEIPFR
jgi:LPS sulfotransferase NodH